MVPGIERDLLKKLAPDEEGLLKLVHRWRDEAFKAGHTITRMVIAFEAGRDGFWLARWLSARGIEAYVIHPTSIAVSREQRRAKTCSEIGGEREERTGHGLGGAITRKEGVIADPAGRRKCAAQQRQHYVTAAENQCSRPIEGVKETNSLRMQHALENRKATEE